MLASKHLYEHYKRMSVFLLIGINSGVIAAVFFGNFLYQNTDQSMLTPLLLFTVLDLGVYLPFALCVIPKDNSTH